MPDGWVDERDLDEIEGVPQPYRIPGGPPRTPAAPVVPAPPAPAPVVPVTPAAEAARAPLDLDKVREAAWAVVGATLYLGGVLVGTAAFTVAFDLWVGCVWLAVLGGTPAYLSMRWPHQRLAAREAREDAEKFRTGQGPSSFGRS
jgi:hypothetical protein